MNKKVDKENSIKKEHEGDIDNTSYSEKRNEKTIKATKTTAITM